MHAWTEYCKTVTFFVMKLYFKCNNIGKSYEIHFGAMNNNNESDENCQENEKQHKTADFKK